MHSVLPHLNAPPQKPQWRWRPRPVIIPLFLVMIAMCWVLLTWIDGGTLASIPSRQHQYKSTLRTEPIVELKQPIYYPDLNQLAQYRASRTVKLESGEDVESHSVSYLYTHGKGIQQQHLSVSGRINELADPRVVLVVGLHARDSKELLELVIANRKAYAEKHGYGLYVRYLDDFDSTNAEDITKAALMRDAMAAFPSAQWMWYLEQDAIITNLDHDLYGSLLDPAALGPQMIRGAAVVPPESEVHTYKRVPATNIEFICAQNDRGMSASSFFVKNNPLYGQILMEFWSDPLQSQYSGFKAVKGAVISGQSDASLTHLVQWHPLLFSRMAVVPAKALGSWIDDGSIIKNQNYASGDFVAILHSTNEDTPVNRDVVLSRWHSLQNLGTI